MSELTVDKKKQLDGLVLYIGELPDNEVLYLLDKLANIWDSLFLEFVQENCVVRTVGNVEHEIDWA